jgi:alpha-tubulin suppressor-like RCC1 family protein
MVHLWSWGSNLSGQLGLGDEIYRSSPVQVGSLTDWKDISTGGRHSLAIKTNGTSMVMGKKFQWTTRS